MPRKNQQSKSKAPVQRSPQRRVARVDPEDPKVGDRTEPTEEIELGDDDIMEELDFDDLRNMEGPDA